MKHLLKICLNTWEGASRDQRELKSAQEVGFDVAVICKGNPEDRMQETTIDGFKAFRCSTRPVQFLPNSLNRIISAFQWISYIRRYQADVLSCHDLMALHMGYLSNLFKRNPAKLVYDAHEFEMGRNTDGSRSKFLSWYIKNAERFLMKHSDLSIMVNDSIAEETQNIHRLENRPLVIRNIAPNWKLDSDVIKAQKENFLKAFPNVNKPFMLMYHGAIVSGRGIEQLLQLISINKHVTAVILGDGERRYYDFLKEQTRKLNIADRVLFHPAVPHSELWKYVGAADVGMVTVQPVCKSYYYMLPNKFFENIQSLTPVICSDFPEVRRITQEYEIGLVCDPTNIEETNLQVEKLRTDSKFYAQCKNNLIKAKQELCWENEKGKLRLAYTELLGE